MIRRRSIEVVMNQAIGTVNFLPAVNPGCFVHGDPFDPCSIFLPHANSAANVDYQRNKPVATWTALFLCLRHGTVCVRDANSVHPEPFPTGRDQNDYPFWEIECVCGHENCGRRHTIYTGGTENPNEIWVKLLTWTPAIQCDSHPLIWKAERIALKRLR